MNLVWIKRDIRTQDHEPLKRAEMAGLPYIIVFIVEPSLIRHPDTSLRHLQFQFQGIVGMNKTLQQYGHKVQLLFGEAETIFTEIIQKHPIQNVFCYQESGTQITYNRDLALTKLFKNNGVNFIESQRDGIRRGYHNRDGWDRQWFGVMHQEAIKNTFSNVMAFNLSDDFYPLPHTLERYLLKYNKNYQPAGEMYAWQYLQSFVNERGKNYSKHISKPTESRLGCTRLSPYLAWGNVSIRQVYQFLYAASQNSSHKRAFGNAITRLRWHCHFIQKFEQETEYETLCVNRGYETLEHTKNEAHITAWKTGNTGYPMVDACMRCLHQTGWINFRMRAMLVSFFCHQLYQDWRNGVYHLAKMFLDYEPGIHYTQFQMQAGTTGINTIRMYNPVKQSEDHDPEGVFIKKWIPELQNVPTEHIHTPWKMTEMEQNMYAVVIGKDYPMPIINLETASKHAKNMIWGHRNDEMVKMESLRILGMHTRAKRKS